MSPKLARKIMKVGSLVKWIGFPGACEEGVKVTGPKHPVGIVIKVYKIQKTTRVDVAWGDKTIGTLLYPSTIEVLSEAR